MSQSCGHNHYGSSLEHGLIPDPAHVTAVILAAGRGDRLGAVKAALPLKAPFAAQAGERAIERIVRLCRANGLGRIITVVGHHREVVEPLVGKHTDIALNRRPERGMFSSIKVGLKVALTHPNPPKAALIWPVDCPLISEAALAEFFRLGSPWVNKPDTRWARLPALARDMHATGHPVLISSATAQLALDAPAGARLDGLLARQDVTTQRVLLADPHMLLNLNTVADAHPYVTSDAWA